MNITEMLKESKAIKEYTEGLSASTSNNLRYALKLYCKSNSIKDLDKHIKSKQDYELCIKNVVNDNLHIASLIFYVSRLFTFFDYHDIKFGKKFKRKIKQIVPVYSKVVEDYTPTRSDLKRLLKYTDVRTSTFVLMLSSSGIRIGELLAIELDDVVEALKRTEGSEPLVMYILDIKSKRMKNIFFSPEAVESLREWLLSRDKFIDIKHVRTFRIEKNGNDKKLFPYSYVAIAGIWRRLMKRSNFFMPVKVGGDRTRQKFNIHQLRKFFNSQLKFHTNNQIPERVVEMMMGHVGYLNGTYDILPKTELLRYYKLGLPALMVQTGYSDTEGLKNEMEDLRSQIQDLHKLIVAGELPPPKQ